MISEINVLTLFPETVSKYFEESILGRARKASKITINIIDIRAWADNKHNKIDDVPFGGAVGMVMQVAPIKKALSSLSKKTHVLMTSPKGRVLDHAKLVEFKELESLTIICGHYEGVDKRIDSLVDEEVSIGDYVLTGGELPAMIIADAVVRLIPGVLGNNTSAEEDSFANGLVDWDSYTRPRMFDENEVPEVLLSGNHKKIEHWKKKSAIINSLVCKPALLASYKFNKNESDILREILEEDRVE